MVRYLLQDIARRLPRDPLQLHEADGEPERQHLADARVEARQVRLLLVSVLRHQQILKQSQTCIELSAPSQMEFEARSALTANCLFQFCET